MGNKKANEKMLKTNCLLVQKQRRQFYVEAYGCNVNNEFNGILLDFIFTVAYFGCLTVSGANILIPSIITLNHSLSNSVNF